MMKQNKIMIAVVHSAIFAVGLYVGYFSIGVAW